MVAHTSITSWHVVLHEHAPPPRRRPPRAGRSRTGAVSLLVLAAGGLVEEQHLGLGGQGPGQLHHAGLPGGEAVGSHVAPGPSMPSRSSSSSATPTGIEPRRPRSAARRTFSRTREQPEGLEALEGAGQAATGPLERGQPGDVRRPSRSTRPAVGACRPHTTLNRVVLPAPLGPMSPVIVPASAARSTSRRAARPPKLTPTRRTSSAVMGSSRGRPAVRSAVRAHADRGLELVELSAVRGPVDARPTPRRPPGARRPAARHDRPAAPRPCGHTTRATDEDDDEVPPGDGPGQREPPPTRRR